MFVLPLFGGINRDGSTPFCFIAVAGHAVSGGAYCEPCDNRSCICDAGESPGGNTRSSTEPIQVDTGSAVLLLIAALLVSYRLLK
jgi:hypothetical protein